MSRVELISVAGLIFLAIGCNSDRPVSAIAEILPPGLQVTITRTATHPFLARFNLKLQVDGPGKCVATSELFPDTGGVSRRNVYRDAGGRLYVIGQFDVRVLDPAPCVVELREFRSLEEGIQYVGVFDVDELREWAYFPASVRPERPFEKL